MTTSDSWAQAQRLGGLRRFAAAITIFNLLGHTVFGFEQAWTFPLISVATAYVCEIFLEMMEARAELRPMKFAGGWRQMIDFLLPAHITGLAIAMLLYPGNSILPIIFASAVAIASKATLRIQDKGRKRHFLNPSNFGITVTLLLFPWVSIAPPYHFTENLNGAGSLILPAIICVSGTLINLKFTGRLPLILGWWAGFVTQALVRAALFGSPIGSSLNPMTGVAFILFSYYMISDPATTPFAKRDQVIFGFSVAGVYGVLVACHIAFDLFFALTTVSGIRGLAHYVWKLKKAASPAAIPAASAATPEARSPSPAAVMRESA